MELQFTDLLGIVKGVTIPLHQLEGSLNHGTWFDGSSIEGFTRIAESDQFLKPDMDTFAEIPWKPGSGELGAGRSATAARRASSAMSTRPTARPSWATRAASSSASWPAPRRSVTSGMPGRSWSSSSSARTSTGSSSRCPHDNAGYFDFSTDLGSEIRQDMVHALEAFGISVEAAHHEVAAGQHEIDFRYADGLKTADNALTFKFTLKAIAQLHDLYATFMPKPIFGINGSGMHVHQSLFSVAEQRNVFADPNSPYGLSTIARQYMAGILAHARGMIAVLAPLVNSYKRLVPGFEAPTYLTWGRTNRSALIRVPKVSPGVSVEGTRVEVRCPDPSSNTYLAFAAMLAAGLDGIEKGMELADPVEESLYAMSPERIRERGIKELPGTLGEALDALEADEVIGAALGDHVRTHYVEAKREEWDEYRTQVSQWEVDRYLEAF